MSARARKCDRCGRKVSTETGDVYSPFRGLYYCGPAKWKRCDQLFKARVAHEALKESA